MTLLDTNAVIWVQAGHPRSRPLDRLSGRCFVSPATLLELQLLVEVGRLTLASGVGVSTLVDSTRWLIDDPPSAAWFEGASEVGWTRDPFDRLIVAHARLRGWRLATGDARLIERLGTRQTLAL